MQMELLFPIIQTLAVEQYVYVMQITIIDTNKCSI